MHNLSARVRVTVCFPDITEGQINMAKLYSHAEMTIHCSKVIYVPNSMYATYTIWQSMWDVYFEVCKLVNMSVSMSKLSFYTDVNPCKQKKNIPLKQNISLLKEEDIKMLALQSEI